MFADICAAETCRECPAAVPRLFLHSHGHRRQGELQHRDQTTEPQQQRTHSGWGNIAVIDVGAAIWKRCQLAHSHCVDTTSWTLAQTGGGAAVGPGSSSLSESGTATGAAISIRRFSASVGPDRFGARRFRRRSSPSTSAAGAAGETTGTLGTAAVGTLSSSDSPELE